MKSQMDVTISLQAVLTQAVVVPVPAQVPCIVNDLFAGVAEPEKGIWRLLEDKLQNQRSRQHAVPQRVELEEVALAEPQKLVPFV